MFLLGPDTTSTAVVSTTSTTAPGLCVDLVQDCRALEPTFSTGICNDVFGRKYCHKYCGLCNGESPSFHFPFRTRFTCMLSWRCSSWFCSWLHRHVHVLMDVFDGYTDMYTSSWMCLMVTQTCTRRHGCV